MVAVSNPGPRPDGDATQWADPGPSYDTAAHAYAERFLHELDEKPFDRELLTRFAAAMSHNHPTTPQTIHPA